VARFWFWLERLLLGGRRAELVRWNAKVLATDLARQRFAAGHAGPDLTAPAQPVRVGLTSQICRQADIEHDWLRHWCPALFCYPLYHRKLWEDCFVLQALWEAGMLEPGRRGLGFAVGQEQLPSLFAARGLDITATDLDPADRRARGWLASGQHSAATAAQLHHPHQLERAAFDARVGFRAVDMRRIPADLAGYDFVWSVCALEHLGTLQRGLDFVVQAMRCLKPGGLAIHTTEYNLNPQERTIGRGYTVLYQRRHMDALAARLAAEGHQMLAFDDARGDGMLDHFVDLPPYPHHPFALAPLHAPHLRLSLHGRIVTSAGIIIRKAG
jgi:SAM-dependent methyltransferase